MLERHEQIEEKIADISAEQKMIYAENRKLGKLTEDGAEIIRHENTERLEVLKNRKKRLNHELKLEDSIITEYMYQSYLRLEFEPETNKDRETDPLHPAIPESPWEKERKDAEYKKRIDELLAKLHADEEACREKERKELEAEQERKRRLEAEKRHIEQEKEKKARKLLAYSRWHLDANDKFYEAVVLPSSKEYAGEYLTWMSEQMKIKQEQKPLEYFERMIPSYDEYVREKYPESIELGYELSKQEFKPTILQQKGSKGPVDLCSARTEVERRKVDSRKEKVDFSLEDMDLSEFKGKATYEQIKAYVVEQTGLKVSSLYIAQIKKKCGLDVGENFNLQKSENARQPQCTPEKEDAIMQRLGILELYRLWINSIMC